MSTEAALKGQILQVNISKGGVPKRPITQGSVRTTGLEGDSWAHPRFHGGSEKALLLIAEESLNLLKIAGFPVFPGALGENFTTRGLNHQLWRPGQVYQAGSALIVLTTPRVPCKTIRIYGNTIGSEIYDAQVKASDPTSSRWGRSGFYARVLTEGVVFPGSSIELIAVHC